MSSIDRNKSLNDSKADLPSNEDIVDSLIKSVEGIPLTDEPLNESKNSHTSSFSYNNKESIDSFNKSTSVLNDASLENETDKAESNGTIHDDDYIDEEHLKDLEVNYTEEEKAHLKEEAEKLKNEGNDNFKRGEFRDATTSYTKALRICPLAFSKNRSILYANRAAAKMKLSFSMSAIDDCTKAVELDSAYLKAYLRRAQLYEETDKLDEALADYKKILEIDPSHKEALFTTKRLAEQINERNEKLKTEMLGKLKDLGNMILKPFGLSTNNFQMVQDPNTGGYSVNFSQNSNQS